jgi:glycosyltransferase involved in cell wall biosynthesis
MSEVLFLLKNRDNYSEFYSTKNPLSSGLLNSSRFVCEMLNNEGIPSKVISVADNNDIDREVSKHKPRVVFIEALWVVPEKFEVLQRLHPTVQWVVRGHSELPFLAQEGVAIDWITRYVQYENVAFAANSPSSANDIRGIIRTANPDWTEEDLYSKVLLLSNFYPTSKRIMPKKQAPKSDARYYDVACFGAIRPLKNQLIQAVAAIEYASLMGKVLRFHVNGGRCEQRGDNVLKNLRALFDATGHELVEHSWMEHEDFMKLLPTMDVSLCVSFSETFCIVAADSIAAGVPVVGSPEIEFLTSWAQANPTDSEDILLKLLKANDWRLRLAMKVLNLRGLRHYCEGSKRRWLEYLDSV